MRITPLGSGSRGNAIVVESARTRLLVDCGFPPRVLAGRLAKAGVHPESIQAVLLTHEHIDHARGAVRCARRWGWAVHGTRGTLGALQNTEGIATHVERADRGFQLGALHVKLIPIPHDAAEPVAMVVTETRTGMRAGIAHDLGTVPEALRRAFERLDYLLLESNHDEHLLRVGPYPPSLQQRIAGRNGHLSNRQSATLVRAIAGRSLRALVLLHLSEANNTPAHALDMSMRALAAARIRCSVHAATQDRVSPTVGDESPEQLALAI